MGLPRSALHTSWVPPHDIVPSLAATPVGQTTLTITFRTQEDFRTENLHFEVANFEMAYNAFLGWSTLTKFMAIPHSVNLVLNMLGSHGVISTMGDVKRPYDYVSLSKMVPLSTEEPSKVAHVDNNLDPK
jgi:hypothetical protein